MRTTSAVSQVMTYATFLTLSLVIHMLVILGTRPRAEPAPEPEVIVAAHDREAPPGWAERGGLE